MHGNPTSRTARSPLAPLPRLLLPRLQGRGKRGPRPARLGESANMNSTTQGPKRSTGWGGTKARQAMQSLLYGRGVDRARKSQARLGLAMVGFALVYAIIAGRLVIYALTADSHLVRRAVVTDAVATARPDILDRNG